MHKVYLRFYEELNDFLPAEKQKIRFEHTYIDRTSVKDMIESLGVPHSEIDLILVNGKSVNFKYLINDCDDISVYPVFESIDISEVQHLRSKPLRKPKFILDIHLGKLTKYLRMLGIDSKYKNNFSRGILIKISTNEKRTILTRDRNLLKHNNITRGYWIRNTIPAEQIKEVIRRFDLRDYIKVFSRCLECNQILIKEKKSEIEKKLPPKVYEHFTEFYKCPDCGRIFWKGTHYSKMKDLINNITNFN